MNIISVKNFTVAYLYLGCVPDAVCMLQFAGMSHMDLGVLKLKSLAHGEKSVVGFAQPRILCKWIIEKNQVNVNVAECESEAAL